MRPAPEIETAVRAALGIAGGAWAWTRSGHSAFNDTWRLDGAAGCYFVKAGPLARRTMLEGEAEGLAALAASRCVRVPEVAAAGTTPRHAFLVLKWLDLGPGGRDAPLGLALAVLHGHTGDGFGWRRDNTIGSTPQANAWSPTWADFFAERRLAPQLRLAASAGGAEIAREGERLLASVPTLLAGHEPPASLLHGDLWSGNAGRLNDGTPVVFDPAVYFGDAEADLAMTELFGGFLPEFYAAYRDARPLDAGYPVRRTLYNLYHVLNHFHLFGGGYAAQALDMIARLRSEAR